MDLENRLDAIKHQELDLTGTDDDPRHNPPHRPIFRIWASWEEDAGGSLVSLAMQPLWGQPIRYADMMPTEARKLAQLLIDMADAVDQEVQNQNEAAYDRQQERLMEGGPGPTLLDQQAAAMKLK